MGIGDIRERKMADSSSLVRDTARLAGRLAGKKRGREGEGEGLSISTNALTNGVKKLKVSKKDSEEEEEEESRTSTISAKMKQNGLVDRFILPSKGKKKKGKNPEDIKPEPLFAVPSFATPNSVSKTSVEVEESGNSPPKGLEGKDALREASLKGQDERRDTKHIEIEQPRSMSPSKSINGPSPAIHSATLNPRQSPVISLSSSTSRYSRDIQKRLMMKQEALSGWRLIRVEKVSTPTSIPADEGKKQRVVDIKTKVETNRTIKEPSAPVPVLQLEPLTAAHNGSGAVMEGDAEQEGKKRKRKKRRKGKKNKEESGVQEAEDDEADSD